MSHLLNLKILSFPMNNLTGFIAATIFNISSLLDISLSYNSLSGSLPMDICNTNPKLKVLNLSSNHLSGQIPNGLGQCIKLQVISLSYNEFTGSIPRGIGELVELQRLSLRNNSLTGTLFLFFFLFPFYSFTSPQAFKDVSIALMFYQPTHF